MISLSFFPHSFHLFAPFLLSHRYGVQMFDVPTFVLRIKMRCVARGKGFQQSHWGGGGTPFCVVCSLFLCECHFSMVKAKGLSAQKLKAWIFHHTQNDFVHINHRSQCNVSVVFACDSHKQSSRKIQILLNVLNELATIKPPRLARRRNKSLCFLF